MERSELAENLLLLCSFYPSIAEVCRRLNINRQQFNKYLSGRSIPSRHNMRAICDFFGVEEAEILLPHRRFAELVRLRPPLRRDAPALPPHLAHIEKLRENTGDGLHAYVGYYYRYFYSYGFPRYIVKSLLGLFRHGDLYYTKNLGVLTRRQRPHSHRGVVRFKYLGLPLLINDRIFLLEYESHLGDMVAETILYTSYRKRVDWLAGMQCTVGGTREHVPAAGRVVLEYLGANIRLREAARACGLFHEDSGVIDPEIRERIRNVIGPDERVLTVPGMD